MLRLFSGLGCGFLYLPQCLHQIAELYHQREEDDKAIQFLKAEKIYYETALIDSKHVQDKLGNPLPLQYISLANINDNNTCRTV